MPKKTFTLIVVSQEEKLLETKVTKVSLPTPQGIITVLPHHTLLFSQLVTGELVYAKEDEEEEHSLIISRGFLNISPDDTATVMVDSGTRLRDISIQKAQDAIQAAKETMRTSKDKRELILAEASLRKAMLEVRLAQKTKKSKV